MGTRRDAPMLSGSLDGVQHERGGRAGRAPRGPLRILIVEDSEVRLEFFRRQCAGHLLAVADNARDAIDIIGKDEFDLIFLDHDLSEPLGTGRDVALQLRNLGRGNTPVIIHSMNLTAAVAMAHLLPKSRAYQFSLLKDMATTHNAADWLAECLAMTRGPLGRCP